MARAAGETAPLLFTIGTVNEANPSLFDGTNTALPAQIFGNARQPFEALVLLVFVLTAVARLIGRRFNAR